MSKKREKFSDAIKKTNANLVKAGLLNQPLLKDDHYYIDILKFKETGVPEFKSAYIDFLDHFSKFFKLLRKSTNSSLYSMSLNELSKKQGRELKIILRQSDPAFKGAFNLLTLKKLTDLILGTPNHYMGQV